MIHDARAQSAGSTIDTDVCVVGGGVAGIVLARELIGQRFRVCLLESGGLSPDPETQSLAVGENVGFPYYSLETARERCFGGSSTRWHVPIGGDRVGARLRPLDPIDFEQRDWIPFSGWPFDKQHLDPYYERAQAICEVEPPSFDVRDWEDQALRPRLPLPRENVQTVIYKFVRRDLFAVDYPNEVGSAQNVTVLLNAIVLEIETKQTGDSVARLRVATLEGKQFTVTAKYFVIAVGGIETPRLLLLSNKVQRAGLGNQYDLVGRFFMEHPHFWSGMFVLTKPEILRATALYNDIHTVNGVPTLGKLALNESVLRRERLLNQNIQLIPQLLNGPFDDLNYQSAGIKSARALYAATVYGKKITSWREHLRNIVLNLDAVALACAHKLRQKMARRQQAPGFYFANMIEQIPNPQSRITLGPERDRFGQNRVQLNWKITPQDIRSAVRTQEIIGAEMERAGLGRFIQHLRDETPPWNTEGGYHHMGTTRMDSNPKHGVVDADCRLHGVHNLFIAGPSVFPTGGYANPVLTIVALAVRLADHIKKLLD